MAGCCSTSSPAATRSSRRRFGDHLDHDERYDRTDEFLARAARRRQRRAGARSTSTASYYQIDGARIDYGDWDPPQLFFGGASPAAESVAAQYVDTYLAWGETPAQIAERLDRLRAAGRRDGRTLQFGIRLHVDQPGHVGRGLGTTPNGCCRAISDERIAAAQQVLARSRSVGQQRMLPCTTAVRRISRSRRTCGPATGWSAAARARRWSAATPRSPTASRSTTTLGIDHFILSGQPHVEEAYWFAEGAGAVLRSRGLV